MKRTLILSLVLPLAAHPPALPPKPMELAVSLQELRAKEPTLRIRDAARRLGVCELELAPAWYQGRITVLKPDWKAIFEGAKGLGPVAVLTRNEACVHERHGRFEQLRWGDPHALVLGPDIDLRIQPRSLKYALAVEQPDKPQALKAIHLFDASGEAVHKLLLDEHSDLKAFDILVARLRNGAQSLPKPEKAAARAAQPENPKPDQEGLLKAWAGLKDARDFLGLLREFQLPRTQAMRLARGKWTRPAVQDAALRLLQGASQQKLDLIIFVGNGAITQIHTGPVKEIKAMGPWINVLDPEFNLHLNRELVAECWIVAKPTAKGLRTSLEIYDSNGEVIAHIFPKQETPSWAQLLQSLETKS